MARGYGCTKFRLCLKPNFQFIIPHSQLSMSNLPLARTVIRYIRAMRTGMLKIERGFAKFKVQPRKPICLGGKMRLSAGLK
jgi:hypothetical protein